MTTFHCRNTTKPTNTKFSKEITIKVFLPRPCVKVIIQLSTFNNKIRASLPLLPRRLTRSYPATQSAPFTLCQIGYDRDQIATGRACSLIAVLIENTTRNNSYCSTGGTITITKDTRQLTSQTIKCECMSITKAR